MHLLRSLVLLAALTTAAFGQTTPPQPQTIQDWQQVAGAISTQLQQANNALALANWQIAALQKQVADLQAKVDALTPKAPSPKKLSHD